MMVVGPEYCLSVMPDLTPVLFASGKPARVCDEVIAILSPFITVLVVNDWCLDGSSEENSRQPVRFTGAIVPTKIMEPGIARDGWRTIP